MSAEIIVRCTRDGHIQWQQVAKMLGVSVEKARSQLDGAYMRRPAVSPVTPAADPKPEPKPDPVPKAKARQEGEKRWQDPDHKSPLARRELLSKRLLIALLKRPDCSVILAAAVTTTAMSCRVTLNKMRAEGLVTDDGKKPMTWRLTAVGEEIARTMKAEKDRVGRVTKSETEG